jgi:hypothetical protein
MMDVKRYIDLVSKAVEEIQGEFSGNPPFMFAFPLTQKDSKL